MKIHILMLLLCTAVHVYANDIVENYDAANGYLVVLRYEATSKYKFPDSRRVKVGHANFWKGTKKSQSPANKGPKAIYQHIIFQEPGQMLNPKDVDQNTLVISPAVGETNYDDNVTLIAIYKEDAKSPSAEIFKDVETPTKYSSSKYDWPLYSHSVSGGKKDRTYKIYGRQSDGSFKVEW